MIELLILYILNKCPSTVYSIRRNIIDKFGAVTKPSLGTIHPALKRLLEKNAVTMDKKYSDGGKKSTFYSITKHAQEVFRDLFFQEISENPTIFYNQFAVRILTLSMLTKDDQLEFLNNVKQHIVLHKAEIENLLNNPYEEYDNYQKVFLTSALNNIPLMLEMIESLKND